MVTRRERVVVDYESDLTTGAARDAAALALLAQRADEANSSGKRLGGTMTTTGSRARAFGNDLNQPNRNLLLFDRNANQTGATIDRLSGRLGLARDALLGLGPAAVPITALAIPALAGMVTQLGFAVAAGGAAVLAFQGIGDSLKAIEKARLDPTVENLQAAREAVSRLAPEAQQLVQHLQDLRDEGRSLQQASAAGFLPGVDASLSSLESRIPQARRILFELSDAAGDAIAEGGASLASDRWNNFFRFLRDEGRPNLDALAQSVGNVAHGFGELLAASVPLQTDFNSWLVGSTEGFDDWAGRLKDSDEFLAFMRYVDDTGPDVADALGAIVMGIVDIGEAAAPLGGPVLNTIEAVAEALSAIADSDLGTPLFTGLAALAVYSRATRLLGTDASRSFGQILTGQRQVDLGYRRGSAAARTFAADLNNVARYGRLATDSSKRLTSQLGTAAKTAGLIGGLTVAATGAADSVGLTNTASLALMGTLGGPWGVALGTAAGFALDFAAANDTLEAALLRADAAAAEGTRKDQRQAYRDLTEQIEQTQQAADDFDLDHPVQSISAWWNGTAEAEEQLRVLKGTMQDSGGIFEIVASQIGVTAAELQDAADAADNLTKNLQNLSGWLDKREAIRGYREDMRGLAKALNDGFHRKDAEVIDQIGRSISQVASTIKDPQLKADFLQGATNRLQGLANNVGPKAAAELQKLIDKLIELNLAEANPSVGIDKRPASKALQDLDRGLLNLDRREANPKVTAETQRALTGLSMIDQYLAALDGRTATATVITRHINVGGPRGDINAGGIATGGYITGPGGPTDDQIPAWLSNGEFVIRAAAVQRYGLDMLHRLNAMRFADGGEVRSRAAARASYSDRSGGSVLIQVNGHVSGIVDTPWGPARLEGTMREVAREEIAAEAQFAQDHGGR